MLSPLLPTTPNPGHPSVLPSNVQRGRQGAPALPVRGVGAPLLCVQGGVWAHHGGGRLEAMMMAAMEGGRVTMVGYGRALLCVPGRVCAHPGGGRAGGVGYVGGLRLAIVSNCTVPGNFLIRHYPILCRLCRAHWSDGQCGSG